MPDSHLTDLPSRTLSPAQVHRARLRVATASVEAFPEGDVRAVWDLEMLLAMLDLDRDQ